MSRLRQSNGDDYPEAAGKHLKDASVLMAGARGDGTAYLAGYVVECALKALIQVETGQAPHTHDLVDLRGTIGTIAAQAGPATQRLYVSAAGILNGSNIVSWRPGIRYQGTQVTTATAQTWLQEATDVYSRIIGGLRLNGAI